MRVSELSVSEGDTATLNIELSEPTSEDVTLTLTVVGGSADVTVDYDPLLVPVVIRAGVLELTVSIRTIEDELTEATETLVLELSVVDGPAVTGAVDRVTVSIVDDDEAPVVPELPEVVIVTATLRVSELSVSEGDTATLNIELSEAASEDVTLTLTVVAGGSADVMVDYEPLLVPVVIRAGLSELTVSIRTIDDDVTEATETLVLELSVVDGPAVTGAVDRVTVSIVDDDEAPVVPELPEVVIVTATLRVSELSVSEGDTATLNIELSEAASEDVTLTLTVIVGGSADVMVDYDPLLVPVVIRAGALELTVSIRTIDDDFTEATETLVLELSVVDGPAVTGAVDRVTVTIIDDDEAPVVPEMPELPEVVVVTATLRVSELSVSEGDTVTLNIELSEPTSEDVTLTLTVVGGSADVMVDYEPLLVPVVIRAGVLELTVSIRTIEDELTEATETLVLELSVVDGPAVTGAVDRVTVTILDDDVPEVPELPEVVVVTATLRVSELSVSEGDTATLNIELSEAASEDVTLTLTVVGGSADVMVDYEPLLVPVVIRAGVLELTVSIRTIEDDVTEETETLVLELSVVDGPAVTGAVDRVTVTILDDDVPVVPELPEVVIVTATLRVSELSVSEGDTATLNIELSEPTSEDVTLTLTVVAGGSADVTVDYEPLLVPVVIRAGLSELTVSIRTIDDDVTEETEIFELVLSVLRGPAVTGTVDSVTVTILDDDEAPVVPVVLGFRPDEYEVDEDAGEVALTVDVISGVLTQDVTLTYGTTGISARALQDYISASGVPIPTLSAMIPSVTFRIPIVDDSTPEPDEEFIVVLSGAPVGTGIMLTPSVATVTILGDDEAPVVPEMPELPEVVVATATLSTANLAVEEGQDATFVVRLSEVSADNLTFTLARLDGTALEVEDYSLPVMPIVVPAGDLGVTVTIAVLSDTLYEPIETVRFELTPTAGANVGLDTPSELSLEIIEQFSERGNVYASIVAFENQVETCNSELDTCVVTDSGTHSEPLGLVLQDASATRNTLQELPAGYQYVAGSALADIYFVNDAGDIVSNLNGAVTITTSVSRVQVDSLGGPERVSFAVLHDGETVWELPVTTYDADAEKYTFATTSSRFSIFALVSMDELIRTLSFEGLDAVIREDLGDEFTVNLSAPLGVPLTISFSSDPTSTARAGDDYVLPDPVTIAASQTSVQLRLNTIQNMIYGGDKQLVLIATGTGEGLEPLVTEMVVTIEEDDPLPTVSLDPTGPILEGHTGIITARLDTFAAVAVLVSLVRSDASTAAEDDYGLPQLSTTLSAGKQTVEFELTANQDALYELTEKLVLQPRVSYGEDILDGVAQTVMISEDDPPPGASVAKYFVDTFMGSNFQDISSLQGVHTFPGGRRDNPNIGYSRDLGFEFEFYGETYDTVAVHTNGFVGFTTNPEDTGRNVNSLSQQVIGGATPGDVPIVAPFLDDLDPRPDESDFYAITLGAGTPEHRFIAQYSNYRVVEGNRRVTFQVVLYAVDGKIEFRYHSVPGQGETAKVGISDGSNTDGNYIEYSRREAVLNDDTRIVFTPEIRIIKEGDSPEIKLRLSSALDTTATVELIPTDAGTAEFPADYVLSQSAVQIPAGAVTAAISLQIIDDDIYERIETGMLNLRVLRDGTVLSESTFDFTIRDNDLPPTISLDPVAPITEGDTGLITARLSGELGFPLLVTLVTSAAASANYLTDYEISVPTMMTIPTGSLTAIFEIQVTDDGIDEGPETFELVLRVPPDTVELGVNASRAVTILDEALPQLSLLEIAPIREGMAGMVTVTLDIASGTTIAVELIPSHTDADLADYSTPTTLMAMILPGELTVAFTITAAADGIYEGIETLEFTLRVVGGGASVAEPRSRQLSIIDAEPVPSISFVEASSTIAEGAKHDIELRLSGVSQDDITVTFETAGSATSGANADYTLAATTVTFPAEATSNAIIRLNVNADNLYEGLESETIVLRLVSATGGVIVDDTKFEHTVTITDNEDAPTVSLNSVRRQITEGNDDADALVITLELSDGVAVSEDITVDYVLEFPTIDATGNPRMAADAADFVGPTTGTVLIPAGESSADLEIASSRPDGYRYLGFNFKALPGPGHDIAFRQAVATLIDTEFIAEDVLGGVVSPTYSVISENNGFWHNPDVPRFGGVDREERINEAVGILTAASYSWTKTPTWDGMNVIAGEGFTDPDGESVRTFKILSVEQSFDPFRFAAANLIEEWLSEAGIPTEVTTVDAFAIRNMIRDQEEFDAWILGWGIGSYPREHLAATFTSDKLFNWGRWSNDEYDTLAEEFPVNEPTDAMGLARARDLAFQLQAILAHELPYVLLFPTPPATVGLALVDDSVSEEPELVGIRLTGSRVVSGPTLMVADEPAIITILDNDSVEYVIEGSETVAEEDGAYVARLHRSGYTLSDDSVAYTVIGLGPNAADLDDFSGAELPTGEFTFAGHDALSAEIMIPLADDEVSEGPETFRIEVARGVSTLTATRNVTLIDNDTPVVMATLRVSELSVSEGDTATLNIELSEPASEDVTLTLTVVAGGSAVESVDYDPLLVPVVIRAGLSELMVSIRTIDDDVTEETETFELVLSVLSGPAVTGTVDSVTVTILDDDEAPVAPELPEVVVVTATLRVSELSVSEGDTATLNIELSEPTSEDVTLTLTVVAGGSAVESVDYEPLLVPVVIRAGLSELTISIRTIDDDLTEETETFELVLSVLSGPAVTGTVDSVTVTILDDDEAPVVPELPEVVVVTATLRVSELSVSEGDTATLNIELSESTSEDVTLTLTVVAGGSAVESVDYEPLLVPVVIRAGLSELTVSIRTIEDELTEETETFELVLSVLSGPAVTGTVDSVTVTILDDDEAPVVPELPEVVVVTATLRVSELSVSEGDTATLNIELSEAASEDVTLTLTVVGGSAVESVDYDPLLVPVVIRAGLSELTISIRTIDDDLTEETETFELVLSVLSGPAVTGTVDSVTVTIIDDDEAPVVPELPEVVVVTATLRVSELSVSEGDTATLNIELSETTSEDVTLTLTVVAGGSAVESVDYEPLLVPVVIRAGLSELTVSIRTIDDDVTEETETFELVLSVLSGPAVTGTVDSVTVTILDDDEAPVVPELPEVVVVTATLRVSELSVSEGDTATLNIELSEAASEDVTLTLTVVGGSADVMVDYDPLLVPVVIRAGVLELTVSIRTIEDELTEATETLVLELSVVDGPAVTGAVDRVTVSIVDDDEAPVVPELPEVVVVTATLRVSELSVSEGDTATLNIELSEAASEDVTLTLTVVGGSANVMVDYDPLLVPVVIRAGALELTVSIRTIEDELTEATETLVLELSVVDGPAVTGAVDRVTVSIVDDDEAPVVPELPEVVVVTATLRVSELSVSEGDTATLNIELSEAASEDVTLTLTVVGGSADVMVDYDPLLVPVVIRAGVLELTVSIRTIEDELTEATETLVLELSVVDGPAVTGAVDRVTVSILDDDAPVVPEPPEVVVVTATLRVSELSVSEGDTVTLNIELSEAASEDVTLTLTVVAGGSADVMVDYDSLLVPVVIRAGVLELTVSIRTIEDELTEATETFVLVLSVLSGPAVTGAVDRVTVSILDDDAPVVPEPPEVVVVTATLSTDRLAVEEGQDATFMVNLSEVSADTLTFTLARLDGTASEGEDYSLQVSPIVISAGDLGVTVTIAVLNDADNELTETVRFALTLVQGVNVNLGTPSELTLEIEERFAEHSGVINRVLTFLERVETCGVDSNTCVITDIGTHSEPLGVVFQDASSMRETLKDLPSGYEHFGGTTLADIYFVNGDGNIVSNLNGAATVRVSVPRVQVDSLGGPDRISFGVLHDGATAWELPVTTRRYDSATSMYVFETSSSRFSLFGLLIRELPTLSLESVDDVDEDGTRIVTASLNRTLTVALDVSVMVDLTSGTAEEDDYELSPLVSTIPAGSLAVTFTLTPNDDAVYEGSEELALVLSTESDKVNLGDVLQIVTILENDPVPELSFVDPVGLVIEGSSLTISVRVVGLTEFTPTLSLTRGSESTAGVGDVTLSPSFEIPAYGPGVSATRIFEFVLDATDDGYEGVDEEVSLELSLLDDAGQELNKVGSVVTIRDGDPLPTISLEVPDVVDEDNNRAYYLTATLSGPVEFPVTVYLTAGADSTAIFPDDYFVRLNTDVTIEAGQRIAEFIFAALNDGVREGDEQLVLVPRVKIGDIEVKGLTQTITIVSTEKQPILSVTSVPFEFEIDESATQGIAFELDSTITEDLTVSIRILPSSTAKLGEDFILLSPEGLVIQSGERTTDNDDTLDIRVLSDSFYEGDEYIVLELTTSDPDVVTPSRITITIKDGNLLPPASLDPFAPTITEGEDRELTARLDVVAAVTVTVSLVLGDDSRASELDYDLSPLSVLIAAGDLTGTFQLDALQDTLYELSETLVLQPITSYGEDTLAGVPRTVTILEDDPVLTASLDPLGPITEGAGLYEITVSLNRVQGATTTVELIALVDDSTAESPADYALSTSSVQILPGALTAKVSLRIEADSIEEGTETVVLALRVLRDGELLSTSRAKLEIGDNYEAPAPEIGFDPVTYTVGEASGTVELTVSVLSGELTEPITLNYETSDGSAVAGTDYVLTTDALTLSDTITRVTFRVTIIDDSEVDVELAKTFTVTLLGAPVGVLFNPTSAIVTILDDDVPVVPELPEVVVVTATLRVSELSVSEGDTATLNIELSEAASEDVTLTLTVVGGSAVELVDYDPLLVPVVIRAGVLELTVSIRTIEDELTETTETLVLELSVVDGPAVTGAVDRVTVSIVDDDVPVVPELPEVVVVTATLRVSELSVSEGDTATLNIELSEAASEDVTLTLTVVGGSAVELVDYDPLLVPVVIRAGVLELTVSIRTIEDELTETTETLVLELSVVDGPAVTGAVDRVTVSIVDDDVPVVPELPEVVVVTATLRVSELSVSEGDTATLNIELSEAASEDVTLTLTVVGGSADESVDYEPLLVPVVIRAGVLELTVSIRTIEDELTEATETLVLELSVVDGPAVTGAVDRVTVSIVDDDEAPVVPELPEVVVVTATLRVSELSVSEGDTATLNIELSEAASEDVTLTLTVVGGSAVESVDYDSLLVPVVIRAGALELTVSIRTIEDELTEATETLVLELSVVDGPDGSSVVLRVDDDEAPVVD